MASMYDWSVTAANNSSADSGINWAEGQAPSTVNNSARQMMGRGAEILGDVGGALSAGGTANGLTVTANSAFTTLANGRIVSFRATADNTGAATLNVNGIGAKAIRKMDSTGDVALIAGEIQNTGIYVAQYSTALNGGAGAWLLVNPTLPANLVGSGGGSTDNAIVRFDGTGGRTVQNSVVFIGDTGIVTGGAWNGTVGATTPATGAFTTLSASGAFSGAAISGTTGTFSGAITTTALTSSGTVESSGTFRGASTSAILAPTSAGTVFLRPNGSGSTTGQFTVDNAGLATVNGALTTTGAATMAAVSATTLTTSGTITTNGNIRGNSGVTVLENLVSGQNTTVACFGGGAIKLRPAGSASAVNEMEVDTSGNVTVNGTLTVTG